MIEDRLYRFLLPGSLFACAYALLLALYPGISLLGLLKEITDSVDSVSALFGGGVLVVLAGYLCSEIALPMIQQYILSDAAMAKLIIKDSKKISDVKDAFRIALGIPKAPEGGAEAGHNNDDLEGITIEQLGTVYCHGLLDENLQGLKSHIQRSWSRICIAWHCVSAAFMAGVAFLMTLVILRAWVWFRADSYVSWFPKVRPSCCDLTTLIIPYFVICVAVFFIVKRGLRWELEHHFALYRAVLASPLGKYMPDEEAHGAVGTVITPAAVSPKVSAEKSKRVLRKKPSGLGGKRTSKTQ